jgi:hypothetical protein
MTRADEKHNLGGLGESGERLIFVGGAPRSGTTLVQKVLDSHPEVFGGPEFDWMPHICQLRQRMRGSVRSGRITAFVDDAAIDREIGGLIERLLLPAAERRGARLLSEKTPSNALVFEQLLEILPAARMIFVLRDPRAVVASMMEVKRRAKKQGRPLAKAVRRPLLAARYVRRHIRAGYRAFKKAPERVFVIVYERLLRDPETEVRRLCDFLRLPWNDQLLAPEAQSHVMDEDVEKDGVWYTSAMWDGGFDSSRIDGWKRSLNLVQQVAVLWTFRKVSFLKEFDYDLKMEL